MKLSFIRYCSVILALSGLTGCSQKPDNVEASALYIRALPPGKQVTAAFGVLTNHRESTCHLTSVQSPMAERIEIHQHSHENGMMRMRQVDSLTIEPAQTLVLEPGGYHFMVFGAAAALNSSDDIEIIFNFSDCPVLSSRAKVKALFKE